MLFSRGLFLMMAWMLWMLMMPMVSGLVHSSSISLRSRRGDMNIMGSRRGLADSIQFFNSLTKVKEVFRPLNPPQVLFYSCGPTLYDYAHIGNFRAFLTYDLIKRWLTYAGYCVNHVCNLTDVDDKIIAKMTREQKSLQEVTDFYAKAFFHDLELLNILPATAYPRVTDHIKDIDAMVAELLEKKHAYVRNGSIYYRVSSFQPRHGILASPADGDWKAERTDPNTSIQRKGEDDKDDPRDFALWKAASPIDGGVSWASKHLGTGRPGWHIECSAMCRSLLGDSIDIHGGGSDLMFPHHTNEIMQTEALTGKQFSQFWLHNGFVNINQQKMSKSANNFLTLRELVKHPLDARAFRFLILSLQYRSPLSFSDDVMSSATNSLKRIDKVLARLRKKVLSRVELEPHGDVKESILEQLDVCIGDFETAMCDDMNTPRAYAALFKWVTLAEKHFDDASTEETAALLQVFEQMNSVLGIEYDVPLQTTASSAPVPEENNIPKANDLAKQRMYLKELKDFAAADALRKEILALGFRIRDTKDGFELDAL